MKIFAASFLFTSLIFAQTSTTVVDKDYRYFKRAFYQKPVSISFEYANWSYDETVNGEQFIEDNGNFFGVSAMYEGITNNGFIYQAKAKFLRGKTKYEGSLIDRDEGTTEPLTYDDNENYIFDAGVTLGKAFRISNSMLAPTIGAKLWYLRDPNQPQYDFDYERVTQYLYAPIGLQFKTLFGKNSLAIDAYYNYFIEGNSDAYIDEKLALKQKSGKGLEFALTFTRKTKENEYSIRPYFQSWDIDDSETVDTTRFSESLGATVTERWKEPANSTQIIGTSISIKF